MQNMLQQHLLDHLEQVRIIIIHCCPLCADSAVTFNFCYSITAAAAAAVDSLCSAAVLRTFQWFSITVSALQTGISAAALSAAESLSRVRLFQQGTVNKLPSVYKCALSLLSATACESCRLRMQLHPWHP